jgi:trehalose/maltose hydrolase-like predicted phosphorylase
MGGTIDLFLRSFVGLRFFEDRFSIEPRLPQQWQGIKVKVRYKNIWFEIAITRNEVRVLVKPLKEMSMLPKAEIPVEINKKIYKLSPGHPHVVSLGKRDHRNPHSKAVIV